MREEVPHGVHQVDSRLPVRHGHVNVHAENQQRARQLLQLLYDILVTLAWRNYLIDPARKRVGSRGGHLQSHAFGGGHQFTARPVHLDPQFRHILADLGAHLYDRLMQFVLHLLADRGRGGRH